MSEIILKGVSASPGIAYGRAFILDKQDFVVPPRAILKKEVFNKIGYYDTSIQMGEDCDIWIRIMKQHLKFKINTQPTIYYRKHIDAATSNITHLNVSKHVLSSKHLEWFSINYRRALDAQVRQLFCLEQQLKKEQEQRFQLEQRVRVVEQTIRKFKSLPVLKQLLKLKKYIVRN